MPTPVPPFIPGQQLLASDLNRIVDAIIGRISGGKGIDVQKFGGAIVLNLVGGTVKTPPGRVYQVQSDQGDYLLCKKLDASGGVGSDNVYILKPWILRRTPFEGLTVNGVAYTYSANGTREADGSETQKITQDYFSGAEIVVADQDVAVEVETGIWTNAYDTNDSARQWSEPE